MPFELGAKKAGLSLVRAFLHAVEGVKPALQEPVQKRLAISYRLKTLRDGKTVSSQYIETVEDAFPCRGDKK